MMSQLKMSSCSASGRLSGTWSLVCVRSFFVRSPRILGLGAVDGGEDGWVCEGESWRACREVEKGRIDDDEDDVVLVAQPFRRAGKCEMGRLEAAREELGCDVNLHRAGCFMVCRQRCARGPTSIVEDLVSFTCQLELMPLAIKR
jgi:hypothetical protein